MKTSIIDPVMKKTLTADFYWATLCIIAGRMIRHHNNRCQ